MSLPGRHPLLAASLAVALACGLPWYAASGVASAHARGAQGSKIVVDYLDDFSSLDTGRCYDGQCAAFIHAMFDQLVAYDTRDLTGATLVPDAAAAMPTVTNGGKTYTFKLRHDVRFWNGRLVTSADWVYSFERIINPKTQAGAASFWMEIAGAKEYAAGKATHASGIKALGPFGLQIDLVAPDASFLDVLAMSFGSVVDRNQIEKYGKSYAQLHPMGTGPYMFLEHKLGQRLILVRNPHYFVPGVGHVDEIEADIGVSDETAFLRVQSGQADIAGIPAAEFANVMNNRTLKKRVAREVQVAVQYITMNTQMPPFNNVLVRRAVEMAINKPLIVRLISGRAVVANTFLPPNMPGYGAFNLYPYNPARARQLLAQAGYPDGFSTTFYTDNLGDDPRVSQAIIPMLANIGIQAQLKVLDFNTWATLVGTKGKVPMAWSPWALDFPDPNDFFEPTLSCASAVPGTFNEAWYCNPKVDRFAHQLKIMTDRAARLRLYPQLDMMVMRDAPVVPVYNPILYVLPSATLHNFYLYPPAWEYIFVDYTKG